MFTQKIVFTSRVVIAFMVGFALVFVPLLALAAEVRIGEEPTVATDEVVQNDLYIAGGNIISSGRVHGDLVTAGGNILINGPISNGDISALGGSVTILGSVSDDVRVAGGNVLINGSVGDDVVVAGGQVELAGAGVSGDVLALGGVVRIDAPVKGNVRIIGGEVFLNAAIRGNVQIDAEKINFGSAGVVSGDFNYRAEKELTLEEGQVLGSVSFTPLKDKHIGKAFATGLFAFLSLWLLAWIFGSIIAGLLLLSVFRRYTIELVTTAYARPWTNFLRGFVILVALPAASVLLLVTIVGVPLGIIGLIGFFGIIAFGCIVVAPVVLGSLLHKWITKSSGYTVSWSGIVLGVVVYHLLTFVPLVGWILKFAIFLIAIGALVTTEWRIVKEWR